MARFEMRFTGSGGQGVILASVILAEAAVLSGKVTVQSQAYGPEARGGLCRAETILSSEDIWFTKVTAPHFLLALTQSSLEKFGPGVAEHALILADSSLRLPKTTGSAEVVALPILETARCRVGKAMTANIVAVGAINRLLGLFDDAVLAEAVRRHIPPGTEALNLTALQAGMALVSAEMQNRARVEV